MNSSNGITMTSAVEDFRRARNLAFLKEIIARFTGESVELLSYEDVRRQLITLGSAEQGLEDIPLDSIVGSVGRYADFTRDFLPRHDSDQNRWSMVKIAATNSSGLPPIQVYQIGEAYFVIDGNHRVSVARQLGAKYIQAYVTVVQTRVPLTSDVRPDDLILMAEYARFLEKTRLDDLRPQADLMVTVPGQYPILEEHISLHQYYMGQKQGRAIDYSEALLDWYDTIYLPAIQSIRELGVLRNFPERTETDLYLWITAHRAALVKELGWEIPTEKAALDLMKPARSGDETSITRMGGRLIGMLSLGRLDEGPAPGYWRKEKTDLLPQDRLFTALLVPVSGEESGWIAVEQALIVAQREGARLNGLHVVAGEAQKESETARQIQTEYNQRCTRHGVAGTLAITSGEISRQISTQARLNDLVVTSLLHPPPSSAIARLDSGFHDLIQRCPRPVLAVPQVVSPLSHALLAYDGSPKSQEALFIATYLAGQWKIHLTVVTVFETGRIAPETLLRARIYLEERKIEANYVVEQGPIAEAIHRTAHEHHADFLIMGGYGYSPVLNVVLGSAVDQVLRETDHPVLICR